MSEFENFINESTHLAKNTQIAYARQYKNLQLI